MDARKRACFKELPHCLVVHFKRFDFDLEQLKRVKVCRITACVLTVQLYDAFEFPKELDMFPYTLEALEEKEQVPQHRRSGVVRPPVCFSSIHCIDAYKMYGKS